MNQIQITCSRCNGSGHYSFNLTRGTVCFQCEGAKKIAVDAVKHAKSTAAKTARAAKSAQTAGRRAEIAAVIRGQLDRDFGPFADDMLGAQNRVQACIRAHGKTPGDLVNELLAKEVA